MKDKCKWIDGEFRACKGFKEGTNDLRNVNLIRPVKINFCPFCGESLKKPEKKEPIPERFNPSIGGLNDTYNDIAILETSLKNAHDRIDYILKRLENELDR